MCLILCGNGAGLHQADQAPPAAGPLQRARERAPDGAEAGKPPLCCLCRRGWEGLQDQFIAMQLLTAATAVQKAQVWYLYFIGVMMVPVLWYSRSGRSINVLCYVDFTYYITLHYSTLH